MLVALGLSAELVRLEKGGNDWMSEVSTGSWELDYEQTTVKISVPLPKNSSCPVSNAPSMLAAFSSKYIADRFQSNLRQLKRMRQYSAPKWLFVCGVFIVSAGVDVAQIRSRYLEHALWRVQKMAGESSEAARPAAREVRRYFEWVKDLLPATQKSRLWQEIQSLPQG